MKRFNIFLTLDKTSSLKVLSKASAIICLIAVIATSGLIVTFLPYSTYADTQSDLDEANEELEELKKAQSSLSSQYSDLNDSLTATAEKITAVDEQIKTKQDEIDSLNSEIDALNSSIDEQYETMKLRIRYMYENGTENLLLQSMMESGSMADFLVKSEYIVELSNYDREQLDLLNEEITSRNDAMANLQTDLKELETLKTSLNSETANLKQSIYDIQSELDTTSDSIAQTEALCIEYEKKIQEENIQRQLAAIAAMQAGDEVSYSGTKLDYTATDLAMLAAIIECEAGNQSYEGKLAVGSVIVNRVLNPRFGDSITSVIYASGQFSPVASGRFAIVLARGASSECVSAAYEVLNGNLTTTALYFHVYRPSVDTGGTVIGDHVFY